MGSSIQRLWQVRTAAFFCAIWSFLLGSGSAAHAQYEPFVQPVGGKPFLRYGSRYKDQYHAGIDIKAPRGTRVVASSCGKVSLVQRNGQNDHDMGNCVGIEHVLRNGAKVYTLYAHLDSIASWVKIGETVHKGQVLGKVGGTGGGRGDRKSPNLHFEVKSGNVLGNPSGDGSYYGHTPTAPDRYGYLNPGLYIGEREATCPKWAGDPATLAFPDTLPVNGILRPDQGIVSPDGRALLIMQLDGNLVLYKRSAGGQIAVWESNTVGVSGAYAVMQDDGNFVVYAPDGRAVWNTATQENPGAYLVMQDGKAVLLAPDKKVLWRSKNRP